MTCSYQTLWPPVLTNAKLQQWMDKAGQTYVVRATVTFRHRSVIIISLTEFRTLGGTKTDIFKSTTRNV